MLADGLLRVPIVETYTYFGLTFHVHRRVLPDHSLSCQTWTVTEASSGFGVQVNLPPRATASQAWAYAKGRLDEYGEERLHTLAAQGAHELAHYLEEAGGPEKVPCAQDVIDPWRKA
jgi:hypothetical protein